MRIISFTEMWSKLSQPEFTTFRFPRKDKDWYVGEVVHVYYKNRSPNRKELGYARIVGKEPRCIEDITEEEARADGFANWEDMWEWLKKAHRQHLKQMVEPMNKLTLKWLASSLELQK